MTSVPWHHRSVARTLSFLLASSLSVLILVYPQPLIADGQTHHGLLMVLLSACSLGFIHGIGFKIKTPLLRELFGPIIIWPLLAFGLYLMLE